MKTTLAGALEARGYTTLTAVQEAVTDPETTGRDLLVSAQTGSGKTVGFGLAIAPGLLGEAETFEAAGAPLALVIAPTRELALQVKRELAWLYEAAGAVVASTVGGMDMRDERRALGRGAHIVVATPGRLRDHIMRNSIDLTALRAVVMDEADEMLDLGFREDLEFILENAPSDRQTLMFSATVPPAIAKLAKSYQRDALRIETVSGASQHSDIAYRALRVSARDGENAIINVLRFYEAPSAIVFCNTRATVNRLTTRLSNRGFSVVALSGELSQTERTHALQSMRDGRARVCVATDVAARGIDLPNLELVIHAELPTNQETLLHRSGRTGRAGRQGTSVLIVAPAVRKKAERLLSWAKLTAEWDDAPGAEAVSARDEQRMLADPDWQAPVPEDDVTTVETLVASFLPEQLAAAYLRMYRERHSAPEELMDVNEPAKPRVAFGNSVWFSLSGGHAANAEPRRLLPMLCKMGNISREDVGAIRIQPEASLIELREAAVAGFLAAVGPAMTLENGAVLSRLSGVPEFGGAPRRTDKPDRSEKPARADKPPRAERKPRHVDRTVAAPSDGAPPTPAPTLSQTAPAPDAAAFPEPTPTPPVDWNDAPTSKPKRPKGGHNPAPANKHKPTGVPTSPRTEKPKGVAPKSDAPKSDAQKPEHPRSEAVVATPRRTLKAGAPHGRPAGDGPRGPKPPAGKASSKKNRARQETGSKSGGPGGKSGGPGGKPRPSGGDKGRGKP